MLESDSFRGMVSGAWSSTTAAPTISDFDDAVRGIVTLPVLSLRLPMKLPMRSRIGLPAPDPAWFSFGRSPSPVVLRGDKKSVDWRRRTSELSGPAKSYKGEREPFSVLPSSATHDQREFFTFFSASLISFRPTGS